MIWLADCKNISQNLVARLEDDAGINLKPALAKIENTWHAEIMEATKPAEVWLTNEKYEIGLFHEEDSVRVVVWVGSEMRSFTVTSLQAFDEMVVWIIPQLEEQSAQRLKILAQEKKDMLMPMPTLAEAMAVLRCGTRLQLGVGRWYLTYFLEGGKLCREVFDEGDYSVEAATEAELAGSMKNFPAQARAQLYESPRDDGQ